MVTPLSMMFSSRRGDSGVSSKQGSPAGTRSTWRIRTHSAISDSRVRRQGRGPAVPDFPLSNR